MSLSLRLELTQKHTLEQRLALRQRLLALKLELISLVRGVPMKPEAACTNPMCRHKLSPVEILKGFSTDVNDTSTSCPKCGTRFTATLIERGEWSDLVVPFYCALQVLERLSGKANLSPDTLLKKHIALYYSAIAHFGSIPKAFEKAGIAYSYAEVTQDWKQKVVPYLGKLPDTTIASCVGVSAWRVRRLRGRFGISKYIPETED